MSTLGDALQRRRLRAPRRNRTVLVEPSFSSVPSLLSINADRAKRFDADLSGRALFDLARLARRELVDAAVRYTRAYRDVDTDGSTERLFLSGHQPELFHPGVWFKNFALDRLARRHGATAIHLLIDTDTLKSPSIPVPSGTLQQPRTESVALDRPTIEQPFEGREIVDREMFASFADRAERAIHPFVRKPLVGKLWPLVLEDLERDPRLGAALSRGRHRLEGEWGLSTLELPQSEVCRFESFRWFAAHLLIELPRLWKIYNQGLLQYRRINHIRSRNHPVPELATFDDWLEAPFWIWSTAAPTRKRLFVRQQADRLVLGDLGDLGVELPLGPDGDAGHLVEALGELPKRGIRLRSRALMTTMFARLLGSDLFLHGIGGGKYDELTDWIVRRFFEVEPPEFMILSATLQLPVDRSTVEVEQLRHIERELRDLTFNPDRHLDSSALDGNYSPEVRRWLKQKSRWIATPPTPETARRRHLAIREVNEALQPWVSRQRESLIAKRDQVRRAIEAERVLGSREYSLCLYPESPLKNFLLDIREQSA